MAFFLESPSFSSGLPGQFFIQTCRCRVTIHGQIFILDEGERRRVSGEKWQNARDIFSLVSSQQNIQWSEMWFNDACLISISLRSDDTGKKKNKIWNSLIILINTETLKGCRDLCALPGLWTRLVQWSSEWLFVVCKQPRVITIITMIEERKLPVPVYIPPISLCYNTFNEVSVAAQA